jgi:hypothetical protein
VLAIASVSSVATTIVAASSVATKATRTAAHSSEGISSASTASLHASESTLATLATWEIKHHPWIATTLSTTESATSGESHLHSASTLVGPPKCSLELISKLLKRIGLRLGCVVGRCCLRIAGRGNPRLSTENR